MASAIKILIIGNGFGGTYALKNLHKFFHEDTRVKLALVGEKNYFLFTPLLHEVATGGINPENIIEPIRKVLGCCLDQFYLEKAEFINLKERTVKVENMLISYDYLVLAPGAQTNFYNIPGASDYTFALKSIDDAMKIKNHVISQMEHASHTDDAEKRKKILKFVIVGGGPTGVELAAELHELIKDNFSRYYGKMAAKDSSVVLIQMGPELVPQFGVKMREKSLEVLRKKGIDVMLKTKVKEVTPSHILLDSNDTIFTETVIWVAGIKPAELKFDDAVAQTPDGKLIVNEFLQLQNHKEVFVLGDMAAFKKPNSETYLPALAQVAEKEASAVANNIQLLISGEAPEPFSYRHAGDLISLGQWMAIGEVANFTFWGGIAWWIWRTVYLSKLISFRKKVRVALDWTINIFSPRDISQI
jgi:NADH dehydrogenase